MAIRVYRLRRRHGRLASALVRRTPCLVSTVKQERVLYLCFGCSVRVLVGVTESHKCVVFYELFS